MTSEHADGIELGSELGIRVGMGDGMGVGLQTGGFPSSSLLNISLSLEHSLEQQLHHTQADGMRQDFQTVRCLLKSCGVGVGFCFAFGHAVLLAS